MNGLFYSGSENAKNLTSEQMLTLKLDILKPLDNSTAVNGPETGHDL